MRGKEEDDSALPLSHFSTSIMPYLFSRMCVSG